MLSFQRRTKTPPIELWLELDFSDLTIKELEDTYQIIKHIVDNENEILELKKAHYKIILKDHPEYYDPSSFKELCNDETSSKINTPIPAPKVNRLKIPFMKKQKKK